MVIDVLERGDLPFPRALREFQHLVPDEATGSAVLVAERLAMPIVSPIAQPFCEVATVSTIATSRLAPSWNAPTHRCLASVVVAKWEGEFRAPAPEAAS